MGTIYDNEETLPKIKNDLQDENDILKNIRDSVYTAEKIDPYTMLGKLNQILKIKKGEQGVSIVGVTLTQEYGLDLELSNGRHLYTSSVRGERGEQGVSIVAVNLTHEMGLDFTLSNGEHLYTSSVQPNVDAQIQAIYNDLQNNYQPKLTSESDITVDEITGRIGDFTNINTSLQNIINMFNSYVSFSRWWMFEHTTDHSNDINKLKKYGIFQYGQDNNNPLVNFPSGFAEWGLVIHTTGGNYHNQILIGNFGTPRVALRSRVEDNGLWGSWYTL